MIATGEVREDSKVRGYIGKALKHADGTHTVDDVLEMLDAGKALLWEADDFMIITEIVVTPQRRTLNIFLTAGETGTMGKVAKMLPNIYKWGSDKMECDSASFTGRKGWDNTFVTKEHGWKATHVVFTKDLK